MLRLIIKFIKDEEGQTSTEYILLVAVVALIVFKFKGVAQEKLDQLTRRIFEVSGSKITSQLEALD